MHDKWNDSGIFGYMGTYHRVRIFVDFWNLFGQCKLAGKNKPEIDYDLLLQMVFRESSGGDKRFEGVHVYVSNLEADASAVKIVDVLEKMRGVEIKPFNTKARKQKCPSCKQSFRQSEEKGADVALVTDMLSHAWNGSYDLGALLSTDSDFVPAVQFLQARGVKIVVASFAPTCELAKVAWGHIDLSMYWRYFGIK
jgi:hypothetical protein